MDHQSLIHRYLLGDVTDEDVRQLDRLLSEQPEMRREYALAAATDAGLRDIALERAVSPLPLRDFRNQASHGCGRLWVWCPPQSCWS